MAGNVLTYIQQAFGSGGDRDPGFQAIRLAGLMMRVLLTISIGLAGLELFMHLLFPEITAWDFYFITIIFINCAAALVIWLALVKVRQLITLTLRERDTRKDAEQALQHERDRFMSILESMEDGVYIVNQDHIIEYVNPAIEREFGPVGEKKCYRYFHERLEPCPWCKNREVFDGKTVRWIWHSDRNGKTYDLFDTPLRKGDGSIAKLEIFRDISELKRVEDALRESEERYRMIFNEANDAFTVLGIDAGGKFGQFIEVNRVMCEKLGYTREEMLRMSPFDLHDPRDHGSVAVRTRKLLSEKHILFETELVARDGTRIPFEVSAHLSNFKGQPTIFSIKRDITDRKRNETALRESEMKYRKLSQEFDALLSAISDTLVLVSPSLEVLWTNSRVSCLHTGDLSGVQGRYCYRVFMERSVPCEDCPAVRSFESGNIETLAVTHKSRFFDIRAFPIKELDRVNNVILVVSDVTDKVSLQAEAMQAAHLASLGELAAGVAHEINNPVNGIINYAQILVNKAKDGTMEGDICRRILKESGRIAGIVNSLLSFARGGRGERSPVRVTDVLKECSIMTQAQMRKSGIHVSVSFPDTLPEVMAHFQQIQQVFLNVMSNAHDALNQKYPAKDDRKLLDISCGEFEANGTHYVRTTFCDYGIGIPEGLLNKVLVPFFSTKAHGKGTGLGLSISNRIVQEHSGILSIESVEGEFTKIHVDLPIAAKTCTVQE